MGDNEIGMTDEDRDRRGARPALQDEIALRRLYESGREELFLVLADWARRRGAVEEAQLLLEGGLRRWPEHTAAWVLLGRLRVQMGRLDEARGIYARILARLDARNLPALRALASAAVERGDWRAARDYLERWACEDPEDPEMADRLEEVEGALAHEEAGEDLRIERAALGAPDAAGPPGVLDIPLADIERDLLPAPSLEDERSWRERESAPEGEDFPREGD
jgi:tetratricopeptide (TPR) repeat protein